MLIYTHSRSKRKKPSAKAVRLREERKEMFASVLKGRKGRSSNTMPDLSCDSNVAPLSNNLYATGGFKRSVDDWKWKRDRVETAETVKEIERKKKQIAPAFNKGATMYVTEGMDPSSLGRKV
jgi:hypothetical protein